MASHKIEIDLKKCIGCGACTSASDNYEVKEINGEFKAIAKKKIINDDELGENKEAAEVCPVDAIKIK